MRQHHFRRVWLILLTVFVGLFLLADVGGALYMYNYAFVPGEKSFLSNSQSKSEQQAEQWLAHVNKESWHVEAAQAKLRLQAYYVPAQTATNKTIVIAHGYMGSNVKMAKYIRLFHQQGYNVLAPNDRGHGSSQGNYAGYGWPDRLDYLKWLKTLLHKTGQQTEIGLFGVSMGGATVMYLSGEQLPVQVKAIVEDCGYSSINGELNYQRTQMFSWLPAWPLMPTLNLLVRARAGYDWNQGDALKSLSRNKLPIFFIHGDRDTFVPTKMVYQNYRATSAPKKLWVVPKATHADSLATAPKQYAKRVGRFFSQYLQ